MRFTNLAQSPGFLERVHALCAATRFKWTENCRLDGVKGAWKRLNLDHLIDFYWLQTVRSLFGTLRWLKYSCKSSNGLSLLMLVGSFRQVNVKQHFQGETDLRWIISVWFLCKEMLLVSCCQVSCLATCYQEKSFGFLRLSWQYDCRLHWNPGGWPRWDNGGDVACTFLI